MRFCVRALFSVGLTAFYFFISPFRLGAEEIMAVLSSDSPYYQEALAGFQETFAAPLPVFHASETIYFPEDLRVVIAFGQRAASIEYPDDVTLIFCMAPGVVMNRPSPGRAIKISMFPQSDALAERLKEIQPGLNKLAFVHVSEFPVADYIKSAFKKLGAELIPAKLPNARALPDVLRSLLGTVDAFLVAPDPALITHENLAILKQFSLENRIPYYAVTGALVEKGATAAIAINFRDVGEVTAQAARAVLDGKPVEAFVPQKNHEVIISQSAFRALGLRLPGEREKRVTLLP